jgi:hypothetical protein
MKRVCIFGRYQRAVVAPTRRGRFLDIRLSISAVAKPAERSNISDGNLPATGSPSPSVVSSAKRVYISDHPHGEGWFLRQPHARHAGTTPAVTVLAEKDDISDCEARERWS